MSLLLVTSRQVRCHRHAAFAYFNVALSSDTFIWPSASLCSMPIWTAVNSLRCADSWQKIKLHLSPRWLAATSFLLHHLKKKNSPVSGSLPRYRNACSVKLKPMHFRLCNTFLRLMRLEWVQGSVMKTRLAAFTLLPTKELPTACYWGSSHGTPETPSLLSLLDCSAPVSRNRLWRSVIHIGKQGLGMKL